jgi:hypothetical protein
MLVRRPVAGHATVGQEDVRADPDSLPSCLLDAEEQRRSLRAAGEQHAAAAPLDGFLQEAVVLTALDALVAANDAALPRMIRLAARGHGCIASANGPTAHVRAPAARRFTSAGRKLLPQPPPL